MNLFLIFTKFHPTKVIDFMKTPKHRRNFNPSIINPINFPPPKPH